MFGFGKKNKPHVFSYCYALISLMLRQKLLPIALFVFPSICPAQQSENLSDAYTNANSKLDAAYSLALSRLTTSQQEPFLRAQIAWSIFADKEKALMNALQSENLVSEEFAHNHSIDVIAERTFHLKAFFVDYNVNYPPQDTPQNQNYALANSYTTCFRWITAKNQDLLISSERAWIAYRDADIDAVMATGANPIVKNAIVVTLTMMRIAEFNVLVQAVSQASFAKTPAQELPPPPLPNSSPNPDDVKAMSEFQADAKEVLNAFLAKKDDPFFKIPDTIKNVPELPAEISDQISKLDAQYDALSLKTDSAELIEPAFNECAAVELLASWSKFTQEIKTGSVDDAGSTIQNALSQKPKHISTDYLLLWNTAEDWQEVYVNDKTKFYDHIQKAESFADLGKSSAAIKEYEAAYDIISDSSIPDKIKKIREQSLGL